MLEREDRGFAVRSSMNPTTPQTWEARRPGRDQLTRVAGRWFLKRLLPRCEDQFETDPVSEDEAVRWLRDNGYILTDGMSWDGDKGDELVYRAGQWTCNSWMYDPSEDPEPPPGVLDSAGPGWHLYPLPVSADQAVAWLLHNDYPVPVPLEAITAAAAPPPETPPRYLFRKEGHYWEVRFGSTRSVKAKDCKGMGQIAALLQSPNTSIPALVLQRGGSRSGPSQKDHDAPPAEEDLHGDPKDNYGGGRAKDGPRGNTRLSEQDMIDDEYLASVKAKLAEVAAELKEVRERGDEAEGASLEAKRNAILKEFQKARGLGGKFRNFSDEAEKARQAVIRNLNQAYKNLLDADRSLRPLVDHLKASLKPEGTSRAYRPDHPAPPWQW
jgi:hypothetical protein